MAPHLSSPGLPTSHKSSFTRINDINPIILTFQGFTKISYLGPDSQTILQSILSLVLQTFLYLAAFECNTTSDWLNRTVYPIRSCVTFKFTKYCRKR